MGGAAVGATVPGSFILMRLVGLLAASGFWGAAEAARLGSFELSSVRWVTITEMACKSMRPGKPVLALCHWNQSYHVLIQKMVS